MLRTPAVALSVLLSLLSIASRAQTDGVAWRDTFADLAAWKPATADGVQLKLTPESGRMRMDYDFTRGSGYAIARREFSPPLRLPANHQFSFAIQGQGPRNTLEFKLVDTTGDNVWWVNKRDFEFPAEPRSMALKARHFSFAWGPSGGREPLREIGAIEIVVTSFNGGRGSVWIGDLRLEELPAVSPYTADPAPMVTVSTRADGEGPLALANDGFLGWNPASTDGSPSATIDFGRTIEFGGLVLEWAEGRHASAYVLESSTDGRTFTPLTKILNSNGGRDYVAAPDSLASHLRLTITRRAAETVDLLRVRIMPLEFGNTPTDMLKVAAADSPRGHYPRYLLGEKSYWTVVGVPHDTAEALINEEGAVELGSQGPTIEPFIRIDGQHAKLITWNETSNTQSLANGFLPIPSVSRTLMSGGSPLLQLSVTAAAAGDAGRSSLLLRYELSNPGNSKSAGTLSLAIRPLQVNPPEQFLGHPGGATSVPTIAFKDRRISVGSSRILPLTTPAAFGATTFEQGDIVEYLNAGELPAAQEVHDSGGLASAAIAYPFTLDHGQKMVVWLTSPLHDVDANEHSAVTDVELAADCERRLEQATSEWTTRLGRVDISLPSDELTDAIWNSLRSNLAYILINADGAGIQPGSRSYERTWIRDGSLTSSALLAFGFEAEVRAFLDWFAPYQYDNGKIPCCVDRRGPDPVPEHDSHGQYIFAVLDYYHFTRDTEFLRRHWPRVVKAVEYIESLRNQRMGPEFSAGPAEKRALYGLMPESISHEGYSAKPMHSYWDDFFTLKGLCDAASIAHELGETAAATRYESLRDSFRTTLYDSIALTQKIHAIDYVPGCAELGDFDATSTTVAIWPCGELDRLPQPSLGRTFDRFVAYFRERRDRTDGPWGGRNSDAYTPYEWRIVGSLVLQGRREEAMELAAWYMNDRRPRNWNHWAEVVWRDERAPRFIGDMPHTWVGSDFINSIRTMLVYEREQEQMLVIGAGIPLEWARSTKGVSVRNLRTRFGPVSYSVSGGADTVTWRISAESSRPPGGYQLRPPAPELISSVTIDGSAASVHAGAVMVPAPVAGSITEIRIQYARPGGK